MTILVPNAVPKPRRTNDTQSSTPHRQSRCAGGCFCFGSTLLSGIVYQSFMSTGMGYEGTLLPDTPSTEVELGSCPGAVASCLEYRRASSYRGGSVAFI